MGKGYDHIGNKDLLFLLGEEIKQPLIAISQISELEGFDESINAQTKRALRTIDNILLYGRVHSGQVALQLEPVHVGSTIREVSEAMEPIMRASGCHTDIRIQKSLSAVDVDRRVLRAALQGMWQTILGNVSAPTDIVCKAQKTQDGIRLSLTSKNAQLDNLSLSQVNTESSQPVSAIAGSAADLLTSQGMFELLGAKLSKATGRKRAGLGVTLKVSKQLQIL